MDLSGEWVLRDATRSTWEGAVCPSLRGIPLLAKLGQGGMGSVYFGVHPRLNTDVAVKVLPMHLVAQHPTLVDRFVREAQIAARVRSPHLGHVIDVDQECGLYFLVMEYVNGLTGGQLIQRARAAGLQGLLELQAIDVCIAACIGLRAAHKAGIIHRDIKPENIMVPYQSVSSRELDWRSAKLMDLGLARVQSGEDGVSQLTGTESAMGTPGFMAPEQALDAKSADQRSDIFSLGATLYALLAGQSPFHRETPLKTVFATANEPPDAWGKSAPSAPVCQLIATCVAKDSEARFASVDILLAELQKCRQQAVAHGPATPGPLSNETFAPETLQAPVSSAPARLPEVGLRKEVPAVPKGRSKGRWLTASVAILVLGVACGFFVLKRYQTQQREHQALVEHYADQTKAALDMARAGLFDQAEETLNAAHRSIEGDPTLAAREKETRELVEKLRQDSFDALLRRLDDLTRDNATRQDLAAARAALAEAAKTAPPGDGPAKAQQEREHRAQALEERLDAEEIRRFLGTVHSLQALPLERARELLDEARSQLQSNPVLARHKQRSTWEEMLKSQEEELSVRLATQKRRTALKAELKGLLEPGGDIEKAQQTLTEADKLFPGEFTTFHEQLASRREEQKRAAEVENHFKAADGLVDKGDLTAAEEKIKAAERLDSRNPLLKAAWQKLNEAKSRKQVSEQQKRERFVALQGDVETALKDGYLTQAEQKLAVMQGIAPTDTAIAALREKLATRQAEQKKEEERKTLFAGLLSEISALLEDPNKLAETEKKLQDGEAMYPKHEQLAPYWQKLKDGKRTKFGRLLQEAEQALDQGGDPQVALAKLMAAQGLFRDDPQLSQLWQKYAEKLKEDSRKQKEHSQRGEFERLLRAAEKLLAAPQNLADAERKLDEAARLFPDDQQLGAMRRQLAAKREKSRPQKPAAQRPSPGAGIGEETPAE